MKPDQNLNAQQLLPAIQRFLALTGTKILDLDNTWDPDRGTPVFTQQGRYTTRGWTEWTQGFQYGCAILQYDMTDDARFLALGRDPHHCAHGTRTSRMSASTTTASTTSPPMATCAA